MEPEFPFWRPAGVQYASNHLRWGCFAHGFHPERLRKSVVGLFEMYPAGLALTNGCGFAWVVVALLAVAVAWPELMTKLPVWLKVPKTPHERLHDLDERCTKFKDETGRLHDINAERIGTLESDRTTAITECSALASRNFATITQWTGALLQTVSAIILEPATHAD